MIEIWLCTFWSIKVFDVASVNFPKFSSHWAEGSFMIPSFVIFVGVGSFSVPRSMHYWFLDKNNNHYSGECLRLLTLLWLFINLIFLPLYFCNFISFSLSSSKIFSTVQNAQSYVTPENIHWCSSFITTKSSDIYLVVIFLLFFIETVLPVEH